VVVVTWLSLIGLRGLIGGATGLIAGFLVCSGIHTAFVHPSLVRASVAEGKRIERQAWEEARRKLLVKMEQERRNAQAAIDAVEREYLDGIEKAAAQILALEEILAAEVTENQNAAASNSCPVQPALRRRLRDHINAIR
jgi:hypothetical protein